MSKEAKVGKRSSTLFFFRIERAINGHVACCPIQALLVICFLLINLNVRAHLVMLTYFHFLSMKFYAIEYSNIPMDGR